MKLNKEVFCALPLRPLRMSVSFMVIELRKGHFFGVVKLLVPKGSRKSVCLFFFLSLYVSIRNTCAFINPRVGNLNNCSSNGKV